MMKSVLFTLARAIVTLSISGTAQASLSLGPPQPSAVVTKAAIVPALRTARFTRLPVAQNRTLRRPRIMGRAWSGC